MSSAASRSTTVRTCSSLIRRLATTLSFITTPPPLPSAPIASSDHCGTPSFRTRKTSSSAPRAAATSQPTGTPPRASPSTSSPALPRYDANSWASTRPASRRSRKVRRGRRRKPLGPSMDHARRRRVPVLTRSVLRETSRRRLGTLVNETTGRPAGLLDLSPFPLDVPDPVTEDGPVDGKGTDGGDDEDREQRPDCRSHHLVLPGLKAP